MGFFDDYEVEESIRLEPGDYRVEVTDVEEAVSKSSGNPMIVISLRPNQSNITVKHYIVKNDYWKRNLTEFYDSFLIPRGDNNILTWIGAVGAAKLIEDDNGYLKVKRLLDQKRQEKLPPWVGELPKRQTLKSIMEEAESEEDLPF